jgi:hypothetical protein
LSTAVQPGVAASEHFGRVTFGGLPVPGATVTATRDDLKIVVSTDSQGLFRLANPADGVWTITVEMIGFRPLTRDIDIGSTAEPSSWELTLLPFDEITRGLAPVPPPAPRPPPSTRSAPSSSKPAATSPGGGFQRAGIGPAARMAATAPAAPNPASEEPAADAGAAADGFLINGSVNNGAASPFSQPSAFGNNRRRPGSLYNGGFGVIADNSAWDARPYSFTGQQVDKPSYNDIHLVGTFGGPIKIPRMGRNALNVFIGYQHISDHTTLTQPALMPTALERAGDFSQSRDASGRPIQVIDPTTGSPFPSGVVPAGRISPQAMSLLQYYPQPNAEGEYNYQASLITAARQDNIQSRVSQLIDPRNQIYGTIAYQRAATDSSTLFGFEDTSEASMLDATVNWLHRFDQFVTMRPRYEFTQQTASTTPFFANRTNVAAEAGIAGTDQNPSNWGPPSLTFSTGLAGLTDARPAYTRTRIHAAGAEGFWSRRRHNLTFGGDVKRNHIDILSQQDPRGGFSFTGAATHSDFADFLLGIPHTSSIAFGNADKYLRAYSYDAYVTDDWRVAPSLTITAGVRWEYEQPLTETMGRLVNLDVAPDFQAVAPVVASNPTGPLTGQRYPESLVHPDARGVQPRTAVAWRPVPGSSLVVRAGYGIYRNTSIYQPITTLLTQQPPLSKAFSVSNSRLTPFTLADGFVVPAAESLNTFAVDPDFRAGYAHNWQVSVQRDLPGSMTVTASYLGSKGSHLMQEFLPNTNPAGAVDPCPACPSGFVYLTSNGSSSRQAGQFQLRRRLRGGLLASIQYTLSKATDNAGAFTGAGLSGASIAQDWRDLDAERAPSSFDQRNLVAAQFQYTTGVGVGGGTLIDGVKGSLFKGWTLSAQLTAGSGLPLTPVYLAPVVGTGVTGTLRPDLTGADADAIPAGYYLNPAAYAAPAPGRWGSAGRNSVRGPAQFALNAGLGRTFPWGNRLYGEWRLDATNVLNRVTFAGVDTIVSSPQFGLANLPNSMRKLQTSFRVRF